MIFYEAHERPPCPVCGEEPTGFAYEPAVAEATMEPCGHVIQLEAAEAYRRAWAQMNA